MNNSGSNRWRIWHATLRLVLVLSWIVTTEGSSEAHPWGGLVVDAEGTLYFTFICPMEGEEHYACVWRIGEGDPVPSFVSSHSPSDIVLRRSFGRQLFAGERVGSGAHQSRLLAYDGEDWTELIAPVRDGPLFSVDSYAVSEAGLVIFAVEDRLFLRDGDGVVEPVFEDFEFDRIGPMAWGESGQLFAIIGDDLLTLTIADETVELRASGLRKDSPEHLPFSGANILFDLAVGPDGTAYAAYYGNRQILAVSPSGVVSVFVQSESPWSPHGVDVWGGYVYLLESTVGADSRSEFWARDRIVPRVRRVVLSTGIVETIYDGR